MPAVEAVSVGDNGSSLWSSVGVVDSGHLHWGFALAEILVDGAVVLGDLCLLMLYFARKLLGEATNILVFSIAVSDLLAALFAVPLSVVQILLADLSDYVCKAFYYFSNVSKTAIAYTVLLLTMERIMAIRQRQFRLLSPGRCLFFSSLTWFFAAAYNIWSMVLYATVYARAEPTGRTQVAYCFISQRFLYLYDFFVALDFLVTFLLPALGAALLFLLLVAKRKPAEHPGRLYKSSRSIVVFTFAVFLCFIVCHLPMEIMALSMDHGGQVYFTSQLGAYKILHLFSLTRGFWNLFIFGAFRHYVCRKEKVLAQIREQRAKCTLALPDQQQPISTSLLDSDQEHSAMQLTERRASERSMLPLPT